MVYFGNISELFSSVGVVLFCNVFLLCDNIPSHFYYITSIKGHLIIPALSSRQRGSAYTLTGHKPVSICHVSNLFPFRQCLYW